MNELFKKLVYYHTKEVNFNLLAILQAYNKKKFELILKNKAKLLIN